MANKIFYQEDCNLSLLDGKKIAIIGYGSQSMCMSLASVSNDSDLLSFEKRKVTIFLIINFCCHFAFLLIEFKI